MSYNVEKDWITRSGLRAVVIFSTRSGHRCGYVGLPATHPLHGVEYSEPSPALAPLDLDTPLGKRGVIPLFLAAQNPDKFRSPEVVFNVHGGITYSGDDTEYPVPSDNLWWFGYDCAHHGDAKAEGYGGSWNTGIHRTLEYCVNECESLAAQLGDVK